MRSALQNIGLALASSLIALAGVELGLRLYDTSTPYGAEEYNLYTFDPVLGWANRPYARAQFSRSEFSYPVENNALGMRDQEIAEKRSGEFRVAFLGDSFTWGWGVAYGQRFTEVVEASNPRVNALNFGVSGYGPLQYLLQLDRVLSQRPDYVIAVFCLGNDLTDLLVSDTSPRPYGVLSAASQLEIIGYPLPEPEQNPKGKHAASELRIFEAFNVALYKLGIKKSELEAFREVPEGLVYASREKLTKEQLETVKFMYRLDDAILASMREQIEASIGPGRFAVLLAPTKYEYGEDLEAWPDADPAAVANGMAASLVKLEIAALDGRDVIAPADFWNRDGHWRASGHAKIARQLGTFLSARIASPDGHPAGPE